LVLARAFLRAQLNGKQGVCLQRTGPTCAAPATVSEGIAQAVQSRLQCLRARSRTHATTGRETPRLGRGSGVFASPDTGQRRRLAPRGCGLFPPLQFTTSRCFSGAVAVPLSVPALSPRFRQKPLALAGDTLALWAPVARPRRPA